MSQTSQLPRLLRTARGETVDRPPVWMMRQAGRYMKAYRELRNRYPDFRTRTETPDLAIEISLQPFHAFHPDGVILFSDILTLFSGLGLAFNITEHQGPIIDSPIRTLEQVKQLQSLEPEASLHFVREILQALRQEVGNRATILGFVGAPWTLATYAVEGKQTKHYTMIKQMAFSAPDILHALLKKLATAIAEYARYQINSGAQIIQIFDSWAGQLSPQDFDTFALPYQQRVVQLLKASHPDTPLILYINGSAGILERMRQSGVDIISLDYTVDIAEARLRLGDRIGIQGNLDPGVLFGSQQFICDRIVKTVEKAGNYKYILNLGHGVLPDTPEENVAYFFEVARQINVNRF